MAFTRKLDITRMQKMREAKTVEFANDKEKQLKGVLCLDKMVNKRNEKLTTLICRRKGKKRCKNVMVLKFTAKDYELLKQWYEEIEEEWQAFKQKMKVLRRRMNWKKDEWKSI